MNLETRDVETQWVEPQVDRGLDDPPMESSSGATLVPVDQLQRGPLLRVRGEDAAYVRLLASTPVALPPILVERSTMRIIDGMHRVLAARMRGDDVILVHYIDGSAAQTFVAAVRANIEHGKPLSLADREHAAEKIVEFEPEWSDRRIGETCGLSPKTVGGIRARATGKHPQLHARTGSDGRTRPLDPVPGRKRVTEAVLADPGASLREIAARTGTSVSTVRDVRRRLDRGESPIPQRFQVRVEQPRPDPPIVREANWTDDTACASTDEARRFALWFDMKRVVEDECGQYVDSVPLSRSYAIIEEAHLRARTWSAFAAALEARVRKEASTRTKS